jgi:DNA invertase Pin-like site-specific DNA recombinase
MWHNTSAKARGIAFVSLRDNLDLGTPSGRLMFQIIGAMAEFERALIQGPSEGRPAARSCASVRAVGVHTRSVR